MSELTHLERLRYGLRMLNQHIDHMNATGCAIPEAVQKQKNLLVEKIQEIQKLEQVFRT